MPCFRYMREREICQARSLSVRIVQYGGREVVVIRLLCIDAARAGTISTEVLLVVGAMRYDSSGTLEMDGPGLSTATRFLDRSPTYWPATRPMRSSYQR